MVGDRSWSKIPDMVRYPGTIARLKVGSCPNDDGSGQIFICPFPCSISIIIFIESVAAEKTARFC